MREALLIGILRRWTTAAQRDRLSRVGVEEHRFVRARTHGLRAVDVEHTGVITILHAATCVVVVVVIGRLNGINRVVGPVECELETLSQLEL